MTLVAEYHRARTDEMVARVRRIIVLRGMAASGMSQRQIADAVGISQPAVSQQLGAAPDLNEVDADTLLTLAAPVLKALATDRGYERLAVFGSIARGEAASDSDIDLLVAAPPGTSSFSFLRFKQLIEETLGREVDLVDYGGLKPGLDDDVRHDAVVL